MEKNIIQTWFSIGFVTRVSQRVQLVEQDIFSLPEHLRLHEVFSWVRVARSLVFCVMLCRSLFVLLSFCFVGHCVVCPSLIYGFWLYLWYLQILLKKPFFFFFFFTYYVSTTLIEYMCDDGYFFNINFIFI